jgi:hypothetical protein
MTPPSGMLFGALLGAAVLAVGAAPSAAAQDGPLLSGESLLQALRGGGFNIYFRHAQTDWSQHDELREHGDWESCDPARVRQLSASGRAAARAVGEAMRALAVPVGRVLASPYCRTMQTAELMGYGPPTPTTEVMNLRAAGFFGGTDAIVATARALLASAPAHGTNTIIAAHGNVAQAATPVYPGEAEAVVLRPEGESRFSVVARITPQQWQRLREAYAAPR